jgi:hypothetical protein
MDSGRIVTRTVLFVALVGAGLVAGWALVMGPLVLLFDAVLPPFGPDDDDTLREFVPAGAAYLVWAATAAIVVLAGWRRFGGRGAR